MNEGDLAALLGEHAEEIVIAPPEGIARLEILR
jgi:hypothetical protein